MTDADHTEISPQTLSVDLVDGGIVVAYADGREVFYHGVPEQVDSPHQTGPGKDVHVLVTDESATQGVLVYVNERKTANEILETSGVGRVFLGEEEETTLFPGVIVRGGRLRCEIAVEAERHDGRVFVFEEDLYQEFSYEIVAGRDD